MSLGIHTYTCLVVIVHFVFPLFLIQALSTPMNKDRARLYQLQIIIMKNRVEFAIFFNYLLIQEIIISIKFNCSLILYIIIYYGSPIIKKYFYALFKSNLT